MMKVRVSYTNAEDLARLLARLRRFYTIQKVKMPAEHSRPYRKAYIDMDTKSSECRFVNHMLQ